MIDMCRRSESILIRLMQLDGRDCQLTIAFLIVPIGFLTGMGTRKLWHRRDVLDGYNRKICIFDSDILSSTCFIIVRVNAYLRDAIVCVNERIINKQSKKNCLGQHLV